MQVSPHFKYHKIVEQHHVVGEYFLTLFEAELKNSDTEINITPYRFWTVCSRVLFKWQSIALSYEDIMYVPLDYKLQTYNINGFTIEEKTDGYHGFGKGGYRVKFSIKRDKIN